MRKRRTSHYVRTAPKRKPFAARRWTPIELKQLIKNAPDHTTAELAEMIGRSQKSIITKLRSLEIKAKPAQRKERETGTPKPKRVNPNPPTRATVVLICGDVFHGLRRGYSLDDILTNTANTTGRSVDVVRDLYERNKHMVKVIEEHWEEMSEQMIHRDTFGRVRRVAPKSTEAIND